MIKMNSIFPIKRERSKFDVNTGLDISFGSHKYSERLVEIPFLFRNIVPTPANVLDIGSCESIYPIQLAMLGYNVTGIDIRDYPFNNKNFKFIKADIFKTNELKKDSFDAVLNISTLEHFGLLSYGNNEKDPDADYNAMKIIKEILKENGQIIFTAPFGKRSRILEFERIYNTRELNYLLHGFKIINKRYYEVYKDKEIFRISKEQAEEIENDEKIGIQCTICISAIKE